MAYATAADLQDLIAQYTLSASSKPSDAQSVTITANISAEIDTALAARGLTVPVVTAGAFLDYLGLLNAYGAAAVVLKSMFPDAVGPDDSPAWGYYRDEYHHGLEGIADGSLIPPGLTAEGAGWVEPSTYLTRNPDQEEITGAIAEPLFKIGKVF